MIGGRVTSVAGDPARFQRYQDERDGVLFSDAKYAREAPNGEWLFRATADNLCWRDQRYFGSYERIGRLAITGLWDQIPQFYSIDTRTPFTSVGEGVLVLDDAAQRAMNLNAYLGISPQFDLRDARFEEAGLHRTGADLSGDAVHRGDLRHLRFWKRIAQHADVQG